MSGDSTVLIQVVISGLLMGGIYALVAIGLSLIWGVTDIVHFGHGDFMMLAMFGAFFGWEYLRLDPLFSLPVMMALLFLLGVFTYQLLISKTLYAGSIPQLFSTFGLLVFLEALAQFLWTPDFRMIEKPIIGGKIAIGGIFIGFAQLIAFIVALGAVVVLNWLIRKTDWGLALQATSENREWAALMGINSEAMFKLSWGIGSGCVALAGVLLTNFFYIFPQVGLSFLMIAFVTVALGGFGSLYGTLIAALLVGLIESLGAYFVGAQYKLAIIFALYLAVVTIRPKGLFGRCREITQKPAHFICRMGISRTFQLVKIFSEMTALENVLVAALSRTSNVKKARQEALAALDFVGVSDLSDVPASNLTLINRKFVDLASALVSRPSLLMLDELIAGLTPTEVQEALKLIHKIHDKGMTIVLIEHVMEVIMPVCHRVMVLNYGSKIAEGKPESIVKNEEVIRAYLGDKYHANRN